MSKLNIDQKTIKELFEDKKTDFLIPDYQRPYAWDENECDTLWNDVLSFAIPDNNYENFDNNEEYFLGPMVFFKNSKGQQEIIDGQQRLTTLMLLLRVCYKKLINMQDTNSIKTCENIAKCLWKTDEFGNPDMTKLKLDSEVVSDNDKNEFLELLKNGNIITGNKSKYTINYQFFENKIDEFIQTYSGYFPYLATRILNNLILLPIEAESQDTALRIFSTLNDRGKPLSDADIFKAQLYKYYVSKNEKEDFICKWKLLEDKVNSIFSPINGGTPMDTLFTNYMYYERAKAGLKKSTTESLRGFYEKDKYKLLKNDYIFDNLICLADFWKDIKEINRTRFNEQICKKLFILKYAPNGMWEYFVSVYFLHNKDNLNMDDFYNFLNKMIAFIWTYAITNPGVNALRTPIYNEMVNIILNKPIEYTDYKFNAEKLKNIFNNFTFSYNRQITRSMLTWWTFYNEKQALPENINTKFDIEHIFAKNRQEKEKLLQNIENIELLGNKVLLEKHINIRASDYRFEDKKRYYLGQIKNKERTNIIELVELSNLHNDFLEQDIINRNNLIIDTFIEYLRKCGLLLNE